MGLFDFLKRNKDDGYTVFSPMAGEVIPLTSVADKAFASEIMGKGVAIIPSEGKVYAPASGRISAFFPTGHAVGMISKSGVEIMIHVGLDTVNIDRVVFTAHKKQGDRVKKGELLIEFDMAEIKLAGHDSTTPIIITNTADYSAIEALAQGNVSVGEKLVRVV